MKAQVYIDTNVFLDFYQAATDRLAVFQELSKRSPRVILTEQTVREFRRNRTARLSELARNIDKAAEISLFTTAIVQEIPEFSEWAKAKDDAKKHAKSIAAKIRGLVHDESGDPVYKEFEKLVSTAQVLPTTSKAINLARLRKQLGDPPTSPDRHSIGDELIWETLKDGCKGDLVIVSRDRTFLENMGILKREFKSLKGRNLLHVTSHLRDALSQIGEPSKEIDEAEKELHAQKIMKFSVDPEQCPKCGGRMEETGYEGSDGDEAWWMYCTKCGHEVF